MDKADRRYTTVCLDCDTELSKERVHLGYTTCLDCSDTEKYSSHTVYPHKTGGYVQPVSGKKSDELKRLDRRATGSGRVAKGIFSDKSWDRWLKNYYESQSTESGPSRCRSGSTGRIANPLFVGSNPTRLSIKEATKLAFDKFDSRGYDAACELTQSFYTDDKISLISKSKIINELTSFQMMSTKQRKFIKKLNSA